MYLRFNSLSETTAVNASASVKGHEQPVLSTGITASTDIVTPTVHHADHMLLTSKERVFPQQQFIVLMDLSPHCRIVLAKEGL